METNARRNRSELNFKHIAQRALDCSRSLVPTLLTKGVKKGNEWVALNPRRNDSTLGSFKVNLDTGRWADFATGDRGGDLISLIAYLEYCSQSDAAKKIIQLLGGK
jgi:hypothetical protein